MICDVSRNGRDCDMYRGLLYCSGGDLQLRLRYLYMLTVMCSEEPKCCDHSCKYDRYVSVSLCTG